MMDMNTRLVSRALPGALVLALLALAAVPPSHDAGPAPPSQLRVTCDEPAIAVDGDSTIAILDGVGPDALEQPLPGGISVAACSLRAEVKEPGYGAVDMLELRSWDPTTMAPDPDAISLRRVFFSPSDLWWYRGRSVPGLPFVPPLVTNSVPGVAEPPGPQVALRIARAERFEGYTRVTVSYTPEGPAELPAAVQLNTDGSRAPLPGPHAVLAHTVCAGDADLASLRVVQGVTRTDVRPFPPPREFAQRFRVPQRVELRWIELAMAGITFSGTYDNPGLNQFPVLAVVDGEQMPAPSPVMPPPLVEVPVDRSALFSTSPASPCWGSHLDFDRTVTLEPDHDYWIYVRDAATSTFLDRRIRGDEPAVFTAGIGPYFARPDSAGEWIQATDQALAFRIIARPIEPLASPAPPAPPPVPRPAPPSSPELPNTSAFALSTTPNPAQGPVRVAWSGAVGPVRFEVLDARGRRLAEGLGGAAGAWTWPGTDRDGRTVASGVYFVRAHDSAGQSSHERVLIVR